MSPQQPQPAPTPTQQAMQLASGWDSHISQLDPQSQLPDQAREALADKYYQDTLLPFYLKNGYNPETSRQAFMKYAQRPEKSDWPLLGTAGNAALNAVAQPVLGLLGNKKLWGKNPPDSEYIHGLQQDLEQRVRSSASDAVQQGKGPTAVGASEFIGSQIGMLPYYAEFGPLSEAAEAAGASKALSHMFAGGVIGGVYDSAKTSNFVEGMKSAMMGAETVGAFEALGMAGPLWKHLASQGVEPEVAKSIEAVAKGRATTMDSQRVAEELGKNPKVTEQLHEWLAEQVKAANANGIPAETSVQGTKDRLTVTMRGADGQAYNLGGIKGMPVSELQPLVSRIVEHLQVGGKIERLGPGGGPALTSFLSALEKANAEKGMYDLGVPRGGASPVEGSEQVVENDEARPTRAARTRKQSKAIQWDEDTGYGAWITPQGKDMGMDPPMAHKDFIGMPIETAVSKGYVRVADRGIEFNPEKASYQAIQEGWRQAVEVAKQQGESSVYADMAEKRHGAEVPITDEGEFLADPQKYLNSYGKRYARTRKTTDINELINSRNSLYHETDIAGLQGIFKDGMIGGENQPMSDADYWDTDENPNTVPHVSMSRLPAEFGVHPFTLVLDPEQVPNKQPFNANAKAEGEWQDFHPLQDEFETRTSKAVPLSAVKGIVVNKEMQLGMNAAQDAKEMQQAIQLASKYKIPIKVFESSQQLKQYRAGLASEDPGMRWAKQRQQIPPLDLPEQTPEKETATSPSLVRGSANIPLSKAGQQQVLMEAQGFAQRAGSRPVTISADSTQRTQQTGQAYLKMIPEAKVLPPNPAWDSRARGLFEGGDPEPAKKFTQGILESGQFNVPDPGISKYSGKPGESWQQHFQRVIPATVDLMQRFWQDPEAINMQVTHFTPIQLVKAWLKGEGMVDPKELLKPETDTGAIWRLAPKESAQPGSTAAADWTLARVDPQAKSKLQGGVYLVRHGETDWNPSGELQRSAAIPMTGEQGQLPETYKQTPLINRLTGPGEEGSKAWEMGAGLGQKPTIMYNDLSPMPGEAGKLGKSAETITHENLHGHFSYLGMHDYISTMFKSRFVKDVFNGAIDNPGNIYPERGRPEEVYNYVASAVRTGNKAALQEYADADTDMETTLNWVSDRSKELLDVAAEKSDSLHKRVLERRVNAINTRATGMLQDIRDAYSAADQHIEYQGGQFSAQGVDGTTHYFQDREGLINHLEQQYKEPLNAPELVPTDSLPDGFPRYARSVPAHSLGTAPIGTDPPPPELTTRDSKPPLGVNYLSYFVRPFYDWVSTVSNKLQMPELAAAYQGVHESLVAHAHAMQPYMEELATGIGAKTKDWLGTGNYVYDHQRQHDFFNYLMAKTPEEQGAVLKEFHITPEEYKTLEQFKDIFKDTGLFDYMHDVVAKLRANDYDPTPLFNLKDRPASIKTTPNVKELISRGTLDPKDTNLLRVAATYVRGEMWHRYMEGPVSTAEELVEARKKDVGVLQPLLRRQNEYYRGVPDWSQEVVQSAVESAIVVINHGIGAVNKIMPWQLDPISTAPKEALQKYIMLSYAGALGARPALLVRDAISLFTTGYPILHEDLWRGMRTAFDGLYEGQSRRKVALQHGWLLGKDQLSEMIAGGGEHEGGKGEEVHGMLGKAEQKMEGFAQKSLTGIQWVHNNSRLVTGWGFHGKITDALEKFAEDGDQRAFIKQSGFWFLNDARQASILREAAGVVGKPEAMKQFALRTTKDMVDATQWNYTKGAQPGIYKFGIGRLFGQYGTWPLNYVEYARKFLTSGGGDEAAKSFARLVLAHGAVLSAAQHAGIDAGKWVLTNPLAYGGGPIFQAVTNIPGTMDFESARGDEARREMVRMFWPGMLPGGDEAEAVYTAIRDGEQNQWLKILGFNPIDERAKLSGYHQFVP